MAEGKRKIGEGHAQAWLRGGFKELGQILPAFPAHSVQPVEEPGLAGNLPAEEASEHTGTLHGKLNEMRAAAGQAKPQAQKQAEPER